MRLSSCLALVVVLSLNVSVHAALSDWIEFNFDRYNDGMSQNSNDLPGRLFIPENYNPNQSYSVVLFLHGLGSQGSVDVQDDGVWNTRQLGGTGPLLSEAKERDDFFIYAPQTWGGWGTDALDNAMNQLVRLTQEYNIDSSRMYITGISLGGGGTIDGIAQFSHVYAAGANTVGSDVSGIPTNNYGNRLKETPLWMFHAINDGTVHISVPRNRVNLIRNAKGLGSIAFPVATTGNGDDVQYNDGTKFYDDGMLRYTEYQTGGHGVSGRAYNEEALYDWMFDKTRTIPTLQVLQTVGFDLGLNQINTFNLQGYAVDSQNNVWNTTSWGLWSVDGPVKSYAKTTAGAGTTVTLEVTDRFSGETTTTADLLNDDSWTVTSSNSGAIKFLGLAAGGEYIIQLFSRSSNQGSTRFVIGSETQDLNHTNNSLNVAVFAGVVADANGEIEILVQAAPGSSMGYLNWVKITTLSIPEPTTALLLASSLAVVVLRRRRAA